MMSRWPLVTVLLIAVLSPPLSAADYLGITHPAVPMRRDITLDERGVLRGRTSPNTAIRFARGSYEKHIRSGPDGAFSAQLLPGVYLVHVGDLALVCRAWGNDTSPPSAQEELALPTTVVRGQNVHHHQDLVRHLDQLTIPAIIVLGVGTGIWVAIDGNSAS